MPTRRMARAQAEMRAQPHDATRATRTWTGCAAGRACTHLRRAQGPQRDTRPERRRARHPARHRAPAHKFAIIAAEAVPLAETGHLAGQCETAARAVRDGDARRRAAGRVRRAAHAQAPLGFELGGALFGGGGGAEHQHGTRVVVRAAYELCRYIPQIGACCTPR